MPRWNHSSSFEDADLLTLYGRKAFQLANQEAHRLNKMELTEVTLLLGLMKCSLGASRKVFDAMRIDLRMARRRLGLVKPPVDRDECYASPGRLPHNLTVRETLSQSAKLAGDMGHSEIGTGHLLLSLLTTGTDCASQLCRQLQVSPDEVRTKTMHFLDQSSWREEEAVAHPHMLGIEYHRPPP